jgi:hypothetical protein
VADLVSLDEIRAAAERLLGVTIRTPLLPFPGASAAAGPPALLIKPESLQPTGAFKLRGAYNAIAALSADARPPGVVAHSSGNHGFAVAYAAALLRIPAAIVVPENAPVGWSASGLISRASGPAAPAAPAAAAAAEAPGKASNGVRIVTPRSRSAAARISSSETRSATSSP